MRPYAGRRIRSHFFRKDIMSIPFRRIFPGILLGLCLAAAAPLHAETIDFDTLAPQALHVGQSIAAGSYLFRGDSGFPDALPTDLVGGILDGSSGACVWLHCPKGASGSYLAGLNDGVVVIERADSAAFSISALSASFIGPYAGASYPFVPGILRLEGFRADKSSVLFDIELPAVGKDLSFADYSTGAFASEQFVALALFAFACNLDGACFAFQTNEGQFAVDNLELISAVPEPGAWIMLGVGLLGLFAYRRHDRKAVREVKE